MGEAEKISGEGKPTLFSTGTLEGNSREPCGKGGGGRTGVLEEGGKVYWWGGGGEKGMSLNP